MNYYSKYLCFKKQRFSRRLIVFGIVLIEKTGRQGNNYVTYYSIYNFKYALILGLSLSFGTQKTVGREVGSGSSIECFRVESGKTITERKKNKSIDRKSTHCYVRKLTSTFIHIILLLLFRGIYACASIFRPVNQFSNWNDNTKRLPTSIGINAFCLHIKSENKSLYTQIYGWPI